MKLHKLNQTKGSVEVRSVPGARADISEVYYGLKSVRLWNSKDGGSYNARFLPKNQHTERKKSIDEHRFVKKCRNRTIKVNFLCQKLMQFFRKEDSLIIGDNFFVKNIVF